MVSENWKNTNKASAGFPRPIRDGAPIGNGARKSSGAPSPKSRRSNGNAFAGFVILALMHTLLLWSVLSVAESAGIISWGVGVVDIVKLATLYVMWRSVHLMSWGNVGDR